ncbi:MAG: TetR family transcriptional regulator [Pseudomonadales bacterium]
MSDLATLGDRKVQQRTLETRAALIDTATEAFSTLGFEGISVRQLEETAGVQRGLVAYHFGDKDGLWRAVVADIFTDFAARFGDRLPTLADVSPVAAAGALIKQFVRFSAAHPELNRLMMQECMQASWRVDHLVGEHVKPMLDALRAQLPEVYALLYGDGDPHRYYAMVGAGAFVFSAEHECIGLFGANPRDAAFVERHAEMVVRMLLPANEY